MTTHSGDTSPGGSNSLSNSSVRTRTTGGDENHHLATPHKFNLDCYNSSPEQDDESDQCDEDALSQLMLHSDLFRRRTSIGVQTEYNEDFPPLKFLRALGEDPTVVGHPPFFFNTGGGGMSEVHVAQQHNSPQVPIATLSANASVTTTTASADATSSTSSDGMLQLVIQNFRHMSDTVRGPCKYIQGVPWRIMVMPRQHVVQKKGTQKCLGFFLQCCPDAYSESWSCQASAELRLISQKPGVPNFTRKTNHVYTAKENDWGYSCFMTWADILDEAQGYIKDDKVTLEVSVKADPPKNILTHKEFQKKIQDYKRLADLQCQRGLIDKAIECNTQALKFCKDKDPQCKADLEAQKAHLIEMKLKQSIQRIEKGGDGNKVEDDSATNLNALRQALGTTTRNNSNAKATKNKSTSTKDKEAATNNNNNTAAEKQTQQQQRAGTPPYTTQKATEHKQNDTAHHRTAAHKTSKSAEPQSQKTSTVSISTNSSSSDKDDMNSSPQQCKKKRLYKSVSSTEMLCAAGAKCKGFSNNKDLVALGHFNKAVLNSDDFDFMKDRYMEEEELLPNQIQHFLNHLSEGDKDSSRLKDQIAKLEMIASPFEKPDPFLEELMKIDPKDADKALVKAITFAALERDNESECERLNASQMEKRLSKVIRNKICESCLKEGHFQIDKRETSESGCQTEFTRRVPREVRADDTTLRMMQQLQQQQLVGQPTAEDYMNALNNQAAFAAAAAAVQQQQQQNQINAMNAAANTLPPRRKKAAAKKNLQQNQPQPPAMTVQQQQNLFQQHLQQQFAPKANPRMQTDGAQAVNAMGLLDPNDPRMEMFSKPFIGTPGIVENLSALADLDLSKIQFPTEPNLLDPNQQGTNIFSRQYIEEWFRYSARNVLKLNYQVGGDPGADEKTVGQYASGTDAVGQAYATNSEQSHITEATAALSVVQLNCLNARNIQQKVAEFVESLESHPNFRELRNSIERLLVMSGDDENYTNPEDTVSVVSVSESSGRDVDLNKDQHSQELNLTNMQRLFLEDDPHDYMLLRELKQAEMVLATRLNSILYQLHQASIADIVDRLELKMKTLEDRLKTSKGECTMLKDNGKKMAEQLTLMQKEFQNISGKYEKMIQQLKDRKNEIKKLEKKAKSEAQLAAENLELQEKMDVMKKELAQAQRQLNEEQAKYKRDTQSLADSKKHLNVELNNKYAEVQKLTAQLDEKTQALKKSESQLANERKSNSQTVSNLNERVKRSEVNLLEHKLDDGLRVLERAKEDCSLQIKTLEELQQKRTLPVEQEVIKKNIGEWENKREEVAALISQAKTDFHAHIQAVKSGKQLSQLPKIQVPKPPPFPKIHPMPPPPQAQAPATIGQQPVPPSPLPLERKVITPPGRSRHGATTPQQNQQPTLSTMHISPGPVQFQQPPGVNVAVGGAKSIPSSTNVTPVKYQPGGPAPPITSHPPPIAQMPPSIAPIGVRPHNYQNGISVPPPSTMQQQQQKGVIGAAQRNSPQLGAMMGGQQPFHQGVVPPPQQFHMSLPPPTGVGQLQQQPSQPPQQGSASTFQTWGGGWGDQITNNISELFGQGRSFGPLGSDFGGSGSSVIGGVRSASVIHPPAAGVIGAPSAANNPSSQPIGAGRNLQNASPSQSQMQQQRNGWSSFTADTWNATLSGRQN